MPIFDRFSKSYQSLTGSAPEEPYFSVTKIGCSYKTEGTTSSFFGHEIPRLDGVSDGIFAEWKWDGHSLTIRNDRYGFYPLYYFQDNGRFAVSPSIVALLCIGAPLHLNYAALALFLRLDFFLGEDTPFEAIRAVPPAATIKWKDGQLQILSHHPPVKENRLSRSDAIDAYVSLFRAAVRQRTPHNSDFGMLLSGGRDSRHIFLELLSQGHKPKFAVTVEMLPPNSSQDVAIAKRLCEELTVSHVVLNHQDDVCLAEMKKNLLTDFCCLEHAWLLPAVEFLQWAECDTSYDGIGGDVLSNGLYLTPRRCTLFRRRQFHDLAEDLLGDERRFAMLARSIRQQLQRQQASEALAEELRRHAELPNPLASFIFWNRTRRNISLSPYRLFKGIETVYSPYLDHDVYDLLIGLPDTYMVDHRFHDDAINRAFPQYSAIPYADKLSSSPSPAFLPLYRHLTADMVRLLAMSPLPFVNSHYLWPRLLRCLLDRHYSESIMWFTPPALYFLQLNQIGHRTRQPSLAAPLPMGRV